MNILEQVNNENNPQREIEDIKGLVIHHTGSSASDNNMKKFLNRDDYISAHYMIGRKGDIYHLMDDDCVAYHAGVSSYNGLQNSYRSVNISTIGIEINSDGKNFTDAQRISTENLIQFLKNKYSIESKYILRHKDVSPSRKWDVGDNFWNNKYNSWSEYVKQFNKADKGSFYTAVVKKAIIRLNSKMWNLTNNNELKNLLHKTNTILRG